MAERGPNRWFFDVWSRIYDLPLVQLATYRPVHNAVLPVLHASGCRRVLDIGCGTGQLAARIHEALPRIAIVGCDFSAGMLQRAATRSAAIAWVRGDAVRLPFQDGTFDAVLPFAPYRHRFIPAGGHINGRECGEIKTFDIIATVGYQVDLQKSGFALIPLAESLYRDSMLQ